MRGLIDRETRDLDYVTIPGEEEAARALRNALERALFRPALDHTRQRVLSTFVRIEVSDGDDHCEIDLAIDYRALPAEPSDYGPTLRCGNSPPTRSSHSSTGPKLASSSTWPS